MKTCKKCNISKQDNEFTIRKKTCDTCGKELQKQWGRNSRLRRREEIRDYQRKYFKTHHKEILEKQKEYREKNRQYIRDYAAKWQATHPENMKRYAEKHKNYRRLSKEEKFRVCSERAKKIWASKEYRTKRAAQGYFSKEARKKISDSKVGKRIVVDEETGKRIYRYPDAIR